MKKEEKQRLSILMPSIRKKLGLLNNKRVLFLYNLGLTPLRATALSLLFKFITIYFIFANQLIFAGIALFIDYVFDVLDGMIARATKKTTKLGKYLDTTTDLIIRRAGYFLLAYNGHLSYSLVLITLGIIILNPLISVLAVIKKLKINRYLAMRVDMFFIFFALFTGKVLPVFYIIIAVNLILIILNIATIF